MLSVNQVKHMATLEGIDLLDAAASALGKSPLPSEEARSITTQQPEALLRIAEEWATVRREIGEHRVSIDAAREEVLGNWDGPAADSFLAYMRNLGPVVDHQVQEVGDVIAALHDVKAALDDADAAYFIMMAAIAAEAAIAVALAVTAIGTAAPSGGLSLAAVLVPLGTSLGSILLTYYGGTWKIKNDKAKKMSAASQKMKLIEEGTRDNVEKVKTVKPPSEPTITGESFGKVLKDLDEQFYWDN